MTARVPLPWPHYAAITKFLARKNMLRVKDMRPRTGTALALTSSRMCTLGEIYFCRNATSHVCNAWFVYAHHWSIKF